MAAEREMALVDLYQVHPMNARKHAREETKDSLREFGQYKPIVVSTATGYVVAGNGLLLAARELGWAEVWVNLVDGLTAADELRLLAIDNRTSDKAGYDDQRLYELLSAIREDRQGLTGTGWTDKETDRLEKLTRDGKKATDDLFRDLGHPVGDDPDSDPDAPPAPKTRMTRIVLALGETEAEELRGWLRGHREKTGQLDLPDGAAVHHIVRTYALESL
jgi:hypothetical protein